MKEFTSSVALHVCRLSRNRLFHPLCSRTTVWFQQCKELRGKKEIEKQLSGFIRKEKLIQKVAILAGLRLKKQIHEFRMSKPVEVIETINETADPIDGVEMNEKEEVARRCKEILVACAQRLRIFGLGKSIPLQ